VNTVSSRSRGCEPGGYIRRRPVAAPSLRFRCREASGRRFPPAMEPDLAQLVRSERPSRKVTFPIWFSAEGW